MRNHATKRLRPPLAPALTARRSKKPPRGRPLAVRPLGGLPRAGRFLCKPPQAEPQAQARAFPCRPAGLPRRRALSDHTRMADRCKLPQGLQLQSASLPTSPSGLRARCASRARSPPFRAVGRLRATHALRRAPLLFRCSSRNTLGGLGWECKFRARVPPARQGGTERIPPSQNLKP